MHFRINSELQSLHFKPWASAASGGGPGGAGGRRPGAGAGPCARSRAPLPARPEVLWAMTQIMGALKCKLWSSDGLNTLVAEDIWTNIKGGSGLFKTILEMKNS